MTTLQLNAELLRELSIIAEDEGMLKKVLTFVKSLAPAKKADVVASAKNHIKRFLYHQISGNGVAAHRSQRMRLKVTHVLKHC